MRSTRRRCYKWRCRYKLYVLLTGDGQDVVENGGGVDTIVFDGNSGVTFDGISLVNGEGNDKNLYIQYGNGDQITIENYLNGNHSVKYFIADGVKYAMNGFYTLSRGDEALKGIYLEGGSSIMLTPTNPFEGENYKYTITAQEGAGQTIELKYLVNGRLVVAGNHINMIANSGQADDIILWGNYNTVDTGDNADIVRLGGGVDANWNSNYFKYSSDNTVNTGTGNDHVVYYGSSNNINMGDGEDYSLSLLTNSQNNTVTNAESDRLYVVNEPVSSAANGIITSFNQGSAGGDCRVLSIIECLHQKGTFANCVTKKI